MAAQPQPNMEAISGSAHTLLEEIPNVPAIQESQAILQAIRDSGDELTRCFVAAFVQHTSVNRSLFTAVQGPQRLREDVQLFMPEI
jgi:hypothetical protein